VDRLLFVAAGGIGVSCLGLLFRGLSLMDRHARAEAEGRRRQGDGPSFTYYPPP
jgi:hypothetical protein